MLVCMCHKETCSPPGFLVAEHNLGGLVLIMRHPIGVDLGEHHRGNE